MKLSLKEKLIFSCGNLGVAMIQVIHMLFLVSIFFPSNKMRLDYVIPQGSIFVGITVLGIILFSSRLFDAVTDPIIANWTDNFKSKHGKRIPFMRMAAIPFALVSVLVFFVPVVTGIASINIIWLTVFMFLTAIFFTLYTVPFYALIVDMAKLPEDKVDLGTYSSAFWFVGFLLVASVTAIWVPLENLLSITRLESIQLSFVIVGIIGSLFMLVPAFLLDGSKYHSESSNEKITFMKSVKTVSKNKSFMAFFVGNTAYGVATYIFETGLLYYITVLALLDESVNGLLTTVIGVFTLLSYPFINKFAKKYGKRPVMVIGFILFALTFLVISLLGLGGVNPYILLGGMVFLVPFSQAAFGILPTVMSADCAAYDTYKTSEDKSGMYLAAMGFSLKLGGSIATILFTSFLLMGKDVGDDFGIRFGAIFGIGLAVIGIIAMLFYNEKEILTYAEGERNEV